MINFLTQHSNAKEFFKSLKEQEIFMYSYLDFKWEEVIELAENNGVKLQYIQKGTEDYKKYGECAAKVVSIIGRTYEFKINSERIIKVEAPSEEKAKAKLVDLLFGSKYIVMREV